MGRGVPVARQVTPDRPTRRRRLGGRARRSDGPVRRLRATRRRRARSTVPTGPSGLQTPSAVDDLVPGRLSAVALEAVQSFCSLAERGIAMPLLPRVAGLPQSDDETGTPIVLRGEDGSADPAVRGFSGA